MNRFEDTTMVCIHTDTLTYKVYLFNYHLKASEFVCTMVHTEFPVTNININMKVQSDQSIQVSTIPMEMAEGKFSMVVLVC